MLLMSYPLTLSSKGLITRNEIKASITKNRNDGIIFTVTGRSKDSVKAISTNIISTQRNTVLGNEHCSICLTEHFLAACALTNQKNINVEIDAEELPFGDGSAKLWIDLFKKHDQINNITPNLTLSKEIKISDDNDPTRYIIAKPLTEANFKATYNLDWQHPKIGQQSYTWDLSEDNIDEVANARTFSTEAENQMLGLSGWIVGITEDDFTMPLRFQDEPARHKTLDLIGDLYLSGINPLAVKMHIVSNKGGHALNSKMAQALAEHFNMVEAK
jgi:UDP-3-O-[3-hydroxymyristoyl] N-acetylglucosamine deacetylase